MKMLSAPPPMHLLPPGPPVFGPSPLLPLIRELLYQHECARALAKLNAMRIWP